MTIYLDKVLPIIIYLLLIILIVVLIVLAIKAMKTLTKVDRVIDDVEYKVSRLDGLFDIVGNMSESLVMVSEKIGSIISSGIHKLFKKKGNDDNE